MNLKFVYVAGLKGPQPQLWRGTPTDGAGQSVQPLQSTDITLSLLSKLIPYRKKESDDAA